MSLLPFAGSWVKATAFAGLTALALSDVIISRGCPCHIIVSAATRQNIKPFVYDAAEDRAYWGEKFGREITEIEHLEIRSNLVAFMRALMAPGLPRETRSGEVLQ